MLRWFLENSCNHIDLELRTITYNTPEVSCTAIDHEIRCRRCGKVFVEKRYFDAIKYLISQVRGGNMIQSAREFAYAVRGVKEYPPQKTGEYVMQQKDYAPISQGAAIELIRSRDKAIIDGLIAIFDKHSSYDPHGNDSNAIIKCTDALRADIDKFSRELSE